MPRIRAILCVFIFMLASGPPVARVQAEPLSSPARAQGETRIETDDAGVIRFYVRGQLAAVLDETGFHVDQSINYGGTITDFGHVGFDAHAAELEGQTVAE